LRIAKVKQTTTNGIDSTLFSLLSMTTASSPNGMAPKSCIIGTRSIFLPSATGSMFREYIGVGSRLIPQEIFDLVEKAGILNRNAYLVCQGFQCLNIFV
ncbi:MAG: hypothetical protein MZV64_03940, partial [Ignavibacteriales bacterium]|nr:hypothetical protein [Ignavibacteriales bacterium]